MTPATLQLLYAAEHALAVFRSLGERGEYPQELLPDDSNGKPSEIYMGKQGFMFLINAIKAVRAEETAVEHSTKISAISPPAVTWQNLSDWYNSLIQGLYHIEENEPDNASHCMDTVIKQIEAFRNNHGPNVSFYSLAAKEQI